MNRTTKLKLTWVLLLVAVLGAVLGWVLLLRPPTWAIAIVALLLLIPGRIQGHFYRDLQLARSFMDAGQPAESVRHLERFLRTLASRPSLKKLLWLSWSVYTIDPEVMARNNLGAACMQLGDLARARSWLDSALHLDPLAPLVHYNLAILTAAEGDSVGSDVLLRRARALGLSGAWHDRFALRLQQVLVAIEALSTKKRTDY